MHLLYGTTNCENLQVLECFSSPPYFYKRLPTKMSARYLFHCENRVEFEHNVAIREIHFAPLLIFILLKCEIDKFRSPKCRIQAAHQTVLIWPVPQFARVQVKFFCCIKDKNQ